MFVLKVIFLLVVLKNVSSYKILGIFPHAGKSHFDVFEPMFKELSRRGHQVTLISHFPQKKKLPNFEDISLKGTHEILLNVIPFGQFGNSGWNRVFHVPALAHFSRYICEDCLNSKPIQEFIRRKEKFDLILTECFTYNCFIGLIHQSGGALIGLATGNTVPWSNDNIGVPDNPSYVPVIFAGMPDRMTFWERLENTVDYVVGKFFYKILIDVPANSLARKYIDPNLPALDTFVYNMSIILTNIHHTLHRPKPVVPGLIEVGGMHIGKVKKLPQNIEKWINESKEGVVYFSMGSMLIGHSFPEEKLAIFQKAFSKLPQRVLWKWENDTMPGKPDNVMTQKWMPQFDILCNPNVKGFVAHGGLLGTTEAVHCGIPVIVMPQFGDQFTNAKALEASGGGVVLDFTTITQESVDNALKTILDPSFKKQAEELSARFKDRPMSPLDTAIYWIEYVGRHKGAPHLRTAAVGMPFYQYFLLDVIAFIVTVLVLIYFVLLTSVKFIFRKLFGYGKKKVKTN